MDFGKVDNVDRVDFRFPPDPLSNREILGRGRAKAPRIFVGAPVWSCPQWVGKIYPKKTPARDFLKFYARQFNSIEVNATFYRTPDSKTVAAWKATVPREFRFSPKLSQQISHLKNLTADLSETRRFFEAVQGLGENLGTCFLQLPPHFEPKHLPSLERFFDFVPAGIQLAVEFRHPGWFRDHALTPKATALLTERGVATIITDTAGRRDVLHQTLTAPRVMIRFVGNELHPSDFSRIDDWVSRLKTWIDAGIEEVCFFVHHPTYVNVPELANDFIRKLNAACGLAISESVPVAEPGQMTLF